MSIVSNIVKPIVSSIVKPIVRGVVTRYFTTLKSASLQYGSMTTPVACDRIVMDVYSPTGITTGLPTGATTPTANKITTLDFAYAGVTLQEIGKNGAAYFDGIISNVKLYSGATLVAFIPWDGDGSASERNTVDPANVMTLVNITSADAELFTRISGAWINAFWPNLFLFSESFSNAAWSKVGIGAASAPIVTENSALSPIGDMTADRIQFAIGSDISTDRSFIRQAPITSGSYNASFYVKSNTGSDQEISIQRAGGTTTAYTVTTTWSRIDASSSFSGTNFAGLELRGTFGSGALTSDILVWGGQLSPGGLAGYVMTTDTAGRKLEIA